MKKNIYRFVIAIVLIHLPFFDMYSEEKDNVSGTKINNMICIYAGPKFGYGSSDFSENYTEYFAGRNNEFSAKLAFGASLKLEPSEGVRLGILGEFAQTGFSDIYKQQIRPHRDSLPVGERSIEQQFAITSYPILLTAEIAPTLNQFRTYIGAGIGVGIAHISWQEKLNSSFVNDIRTGGSYVDETAIAPAFTLYTGIELGFDKKVKQSIFAGVLIEAKYVYSGVSAAFFDKARKQFASPPSIWSEKIYAGVGAFAINVGVFFQFTKQAEAVKK